jgi:AcrR family transcriptional regulator
LCREQDVKERIIRAAMKVFSQYGFFKAPVKLIAMKAGVSKGLIFWYFRSKDELILEVAHRALPLDVVKECIKRGLEKEDLLRCIGLNYLSKYEDPVYKNLLLHTLSAETMYPSIRDSIKNICEDYVKQVALRVYGVMDERARTRIRAFLGALMCYSLRPPSDIPKEKYVEYLLELLLH